MGSRFREMPPERITLDVARRASDDPNILWEYVLDLYLTDPDSRSEQGYKRFVTALPCGLQIVNWLVKFDSEILNGGIRQSFWNLSNWEVDETLKALEKIGAAESADYLRRAIHVFETGDIPKGRSAYWFEDNDFRHERTLNEIDEARCTDSASKRDHRLLGEYVRRHPEEFLHG